MDIYLEPKRVTKFLVFLVLCLTVAHVAGKISALYFGRDYVFGLVPLFDFYKEKNFPTMYSTQALLIAAALLAVVAYVKKQRQEPFYLYWAVLSLIFVFLAVDEMIEIHERFGRLVRPLLTGFGPAYYNSWIVAYSIPVMIVGLAYVRFVWRLPPKTRLLFIVAGFIFIFGAVGLEAAAGIHNYIFGWTRDKSDTNVTYALLSTIEEFMEMAGIIVFIYAIMSYIDTEFKGLTFGIASRPSEAPAPAVEAFSGQGIDLSPPETQPGVSQSLGSG